MAKILLVEKRYDGTEESPSVTAQWIEIPDGKEELFLAEQLSNGKDYNLLEKKDKLPNQERIIDTTFADTIIKLSTPISLLVFAIVALFKLFTL
jgi:hypothetical protein